MSNISEAAKNFIYQFIDSVELLEILLLLSSDSQREWNAQQISEHFRSNLSSVQRRLHRLLELKLIKENQSKPDTYEFNPKDSQQKHIIKEIQHIYLIKPRHVFDVIFNPLKSTQVEEDK